MALAMLSTAIMRKPSATCSGERASPLASVMSAASSAKRRRTTAQSRGLSAPGPKTRGKKSGWILPSMTLQSVTASGPSRR